MSGTRFTFASGEDLVLDVTGEDVTALQQLLRKFGFLRNISTLGVFDDATRSAVEHYQKFFSLKPDGVVGPVTKNMLVQPRCGVPDIPEDKSGHWTAGAFVARGCSYQKNDLTYIFENFSRWLGPPVCRMVIRQAFAAWQAVSPLRFREAGPGETPDLRIAWESGHHHDGSPFDGPGNILAHAYYPPPCGGPHAGSLHFDDSETWVVDAGKQGFQLFQVALHEIGHLLGLAHSSDRQAVMYASYDAARTTLSRDDIQGISSLYT